MSTAAHHPPGGPEPDRLAADELIDNSQLRIVVCCGSGGVGKTTTAAALAVRAAERGRKVVVLTIDPARRLAQALGLPELDNEPRPVESVDGSRGGRLDAMMLDMKRTFDEVVQTHAPPERVRQILENPFYQALSSSFAGTQEYMAMERLGQLSSAAAESGDYDLIVVDTPPSRSALDFLDAPGRLSSFLDGRFIRILGGSARGPLKLFSAGMGMVTGVLTKVLGAQVLADIQTFVGALDTTFGGFRERAEATYRLLQQDGTAFLVVAAPEPDALREAAYFVDRLGTDRMPLAGLVLNRVTRPGAPGLSAERCLSAAEAWDEESTERVTGRVRSAYDESLAEEGAEGLVGSILRLHAQRVRLADRENRLVHGFRSGHREVPLGWVPALPDDVHDLDSLRVIGAQLADQAR